MDPTIILKNALGLIADGTVDVQYPLRCAPREVLMKHAKDALTRYEDAILTKQRTPLVVTIHNCDDNIVGESPNYYCGICGRWLR